MPRDFDRFFQDNCCRHNCTPRHCCWNCRNDGRDDRRGQRDDRHEHRHDDRRDRRDDRHEHRHDDRRDRRDDNWPWR